jgi:predicted site-specific integrase-resolvase
MTTQYLKATDVAKILNVSLSTLANWRRQGKGPAFKKIGGAVRYLPLKP